MKLIAPLLLTATAVCGCGRSPQTLVVTTNHSASFTADDLRSLATNVDQPMWRSNPVMAFELLTNTPAGRKLRAAFEQAKREIEDTKQRFRTRTDHVAVLAACRDVMRRRSEFAHDPKWYGGDPSHRETSMISPTDERLPEVLRAVGASSLIVQDHMLLLEMGGGPYHYGMIAYAADQEKSDSKTSKNERLIDGLWLYSE